MPMVAYGVPVQSHPPPLNYQNHHTNHRQAQLVENELNLSESVAENLSVSDLAMSQNYDPKKWSKEKRESQQSRGGGFL